MTLTRLRHDPVLEEMTVPSISDPRMGHVWKHRAALNNALTTSRRGVRGLQ